MTSHQILIRTKEGSGVLSWNGTTLNQPPHYPFIPNSTDCSWSSDGSTLFISTNDTLHVFSGTSLSPTASISLPNLATFSPSPSGAYVTTLCRPSTDKPAKSDKNLRIYRISDSTPIYSSHLEHHNQDKWPLIKYSADERFALRVLPSSIQFLSLSSSEPLSRVIYTYEQANIFTVDISPSFGAYHLFVFLKQPQQANHTLVVLSIPSHLALTGVGPTVLFRQVVGACSSISVKYGPVINNLVNYAVVLLVFDVDRTNASYHGTVRSLYVPLIMNKERGKEPKRLSLPEGPTHDVSVRRNGDFIVLAGYNPCVGYVFDCQGNRKPNQLPQRNQSQLSFSPGGQLLAVSGFGNLRSGFIFYKFTNDHFNKRIDCPSIENITTWEWLNDGSGIVMATTCPRLRVGNQVSILGNNGALLSTIEYDVLYCAVPRPPRGDASKVIDTLLPLSNEVAKQHQVETRAYVPPHLRKSVAERTTTSLSDLSGEKVIVPPSGSVGGGGRLPPGVTREYLQSNKGGKKKKEKKKEKKEAFVIEADF
ncbi:hypothetical protein P9112_000644 [Eukaryota sp. TZLM1-RC]